MELLQQNGIEEDAFSMEENYLAIDMRKSYLQRNEVPKASESEHDYQDFQAKTFAKWRAPANSSDEIVSDG